MSEQERLVTYAVQLLSANKVINRLEAEVAQLRQALRKICDTDLLVFFPVVSDDGEHTLAQKNARFGFRAAQEIARAALAAPLAAPEPE